MLHAPLYVPTILSAASTAVSFAINSAQAMIDPTNAAAVSAVGEISAVPALQCLKEKLMQTQSGRYILQVQPHVGDKLLEEARQLPEGSFGRRYADYMDHNKFTPDGRTAVKYVDDKLLAYIMTRYRQCHDFLHTCTDCGRTVHEEVAVKLLEYQHTGLPLGVLAVPGAVLHLSREQRQSAGEYWKWAKHNAPCSVHGERTVPNYLSHIWEDYLELPMEEVQRITGLTPLNTFLKKNDAPEQSEEVSSNA